MANNIGITLLNKTVFKVVEFNYPYFLSFVHMVINTMGCNFVNWCIDIDNRRLKGDPTAVPGWIQQGLGAISRKELDAKGRWTMLCFSVVFSLNIAIGNVSLKHVSVNFNQVMRSLVPAIVILMGLFLGRHFSLRKQLSVLPIIFGVAMACFGDMSYDTVGLLYTILCTVLAALKVVASGELLTGQLKLHPVDLMSRLAPLASVQCLFLSLCTGEIGDILKRWNDDLNPAINATPAVVVLVSGMCAFTFNISSFMANKVTSPLTICIAGNVKQVLMIGLSTVLFQVEITPLNGAGIVVVLLGSANYSYISLMERTADAAAAPSRGIDENGDDEAELELMEASRHGE